jgi:hypothetical protein
VTVQTLGRALALAAVWLSPPALLGLMHALLLDGTRGLFGSVALAAGAAVAGITLWRPWSRLPSEAGATPVDVARERWPGAGSVPWLAVPVAAVALLFLWAQLAAIGEVARGAGWSAPGVIAGLVLVIGLVAWRPAARHWLAALAGAVLMAGLGASLAAVMVATDPVWPRVFEAVLSRGRAVFAPEGAWVVAGRPLRGPGAELVLSITEEQRVTILEPGRIRLDRWEGGSSTQEVRAGAEAHLRSGDRLVVPAGLTVRFQAARAVPGAPATGAAWLDPPGARADARTLVGLGLTLIAGAAGLAPAHASLPTRGRGRRAAGGGSAMLAAAFAALGALGVVLWGLYAVWLTPEIYTGGVLPVEALELPARARRMGQADRVGALPGLALGAGALAAACAAMAALPRPGAADSGAARGAGRAIAGLGLGLAGLLAVATPVASWPLLLAAFGVAASTLAPGALVACWREGLSDRAVIAGAGVGGVIFAALSLGSLGAPRSPAGGSWVAWLVAWPVVVALPANALVAWLLAPAPAPAGRGALPADLAALHDD